MDAPENCDRCGLVHSDACASSAVSAPDALGDPSPRDLAFIGRIQRRDHDAIAELFDHYYESVFSIAYRVLRDTGEAEDLVQEVFLYLFKNANAYDPEKGTVRAWIVRVAWHRSLNRKQYLMSRCFYHHDPVDSMNSPPSVDPRDLGHLRDKQELLEMAFKSLTERQRKTIRMHCYEGWEMHEIATAMDDSVTNVRAHYYRGLAKLRSMLVKRCAAAETA